MDSLTLPIFTENRFRAMPSSEWWRQSTIHVTEKIPIINGNCNWIFWAGRDNLPESDDDDDDDVAMVTPVCTPYLTPSLSTFSLSISLSAQNQPLFSSYLHPSPLPCPTLWPFQPSMTMSSCIFLLPFTCCVFNCSISREGKNSREGERGTCARERE